MVSDGEGRDSRARASCKRPASNRTEKRELTFARFHTKTHTHTHTHTGVHQLWIRYRMKESAEFLKIVMGKHMKTHFSFGKTASTYRCRTASNARSSGVDPGVALDDRAAALDKALDHPIGSEPLSALAAGKKSAAISVCDITRPAPNRITLPPLLKRLHQAGIPVENITILIATGLHRRATEDEVKQNSRTGDCRGLSRREPRCAGAKRAPFVGLHQAGNACLYRRALHDGGSAHHSGLY